MTISIISRLQMGNLRLRVVKLVTGDHTARNYKAGWLMVLNSQMHASLLCPTSHTSVYALRCP